MDFEIYWGPLSSYELGKMKVEEDCRDPRFEIILARAVDFRGEAITITPPPDVEPNPLAYWKQKLTEILASFDGVICDNAYFDGFISEDVLKVPII